MELFIIWVLCGVAGYFIGDAKGKAGVGALLGGFLGFIGLIIIAVLPATPEVEARKHQALTSAIRQARQEPVPTPVTMGDRLSEIEALRFQGVLTPEEAAAARKRVIEAR